MREWLRRPAIFFIISTAIIAAYSNTFNAPFAFDDLIYITDNQAIRELSNLWPPLGTRYTGYLSFALNYRIGAYDVTGYHVFNTAVHIINSLLVYLMASLALSSPACRDAFAQSKGRIALFASLLFALHPIQTQSVVYIAQRFASIATLFYLLSIVLYLMWRSDRKTGYGVYFLSILSGFLAMRSKEISFTLPVMAAFLEFTFFNGDVKKRLLALIPFAVAALTIPLSFLLSADPGGILGLKTMAQQRAELESLSKYEYLISQFWAIGRYMRLLVFPAGQNLLYDMPAFKSFFTPKVFLSFILVASVAFGAIFAYMKALRKGGAALVISFGILWFFIALSVESSIIPIQDIIFEHRVYLPMAGASIAFATAFFHVAGRNGLAKLVAATFIIAALGAATYARNMVWSDTLTLWEDVVRKSPWSSLGHMNLGVEYYSRKMTDKAILEFKEAIRLTPANSMVRKNLASLYFDIGRCDDAQAEYMGALPYEQDKSYIHYQLGLARLECGKISEAMQDFHKALEYKQEYFEVYWGLGEGYLRAGQLSESVKYFRLFIEKASPSYQKHKEKAAMKIRMAGGM